MGCRDRRFVALGSRLKGVPEVLTLGVRPNFHDYTTRETSLIMDSPIILYPTLNYSQFLSTMGKAVFPSVDTYLYSDDKIKQTTLFYMLGVPHPFTRFYYHLHHEFILKEYSFPFVAKLPRTSARGRGVFLITCAQELERYLRFTPVAYIQEFLPHDRDLRVILIGYEPVLAYWRCRPPGGFKTNLSQGGTIDFAGVPHDAVHLAKDVARSCRFNDVGLDLIHHEGRWLVIEANMNYGRRGLRLRGMNLKAILTEKLISGDLQSEVRGAQPLMTGSNVL
ncbi:MAG: RimK family alpha-L-glutamate ligase [Thermodesulfobacteriota bacterium]